MDMKGEKGQPKSVCKDVNKFDVTSVKTYFCCKYLHTKTAVKPYSGRSYCTKKEEVYLWSVGTSVDFSKVILDFQIMGILVSPVAKPHTTVYALWYLHIVIAIVFLILKLNIYSTQ